MRIFLLVVVFVVVAGVGFVHAQSQSVDMVVLVDSSASMFPYWTDATHYLLRNILNQVLQRGDTFHLLSFAAHPQVDVSKRIESHKDIQYILARYLLLQPLGRYTDLVAAIRYVYQYANKLPAASKKEVFILTDGIDDPPPGSEYPITYGPKGPDAGHLRRIVDDTVQAMRRQGWQVHIIQYPRAGSSPPPRVPQPGVELLGPSEVRTVRPGTGPQATQEMPPAAAAARKPAANATKPMGGQPQTTSVPRPPQRVEAPQQRPAPEKPLQPTAQPTGAPPIPATTAPAQTPSPPASAAGTTGTAVPRVVPGGAGPSSGPSATTAPSGVNAGREAASAGAAPPAATQGIIQGAQAGHPSEPAPTASPSAAPEGSTTSTSSQPATAPSTAPAASRARAGEAGATAATPTASAESGSATTQGAGVPLARNHGVIGHRRIGTYLLFVLFGIVFIAVVVLIIILIRRLIENLRATPIVPMAAKNRLGGANGSIFAIEFRVTGQNPNIGGRNIRPMGPGARRTVGGRGSAFLIYLYPCPPNIGEVVFDNGSYTFLPTKSEHFPGSPGKLPDCLGKPIRVLPDGVHEVMIWFRHYVSPLDEVNRIMHLVDKPGTPTAPST